MRALRTPAAARPAVRRFGAPAAEEAPIVFAEKDMWHKKSGMDFVINECGRADFMPFLVGLGYVPLRPLISDDPPAADPRRTAAPAHPFCHMR
jgi:hypothetical protein